MNNFYFGGSDSSDSGNDTLPYPKPLTRAAFLTPDFDAATFLSGLHNRHQTLEDLTAELRARSQELNKELLDLVNNNYQDFLSLGGSLKGGDERIEEVKLGLLGFRRDVEGLKSKVESRKIEVEALVDERKVIRRDIQLGRMLLEIDQRLLELEEKLMLVSVNPTASGRENGSELTSDSAGESDEEQSISLSRLKRHAQQYVYVTRLMDKVGMDHPFVSKQLDRTMKVKNTILLDLSTALRQTQSPPIADQSRILRILDVYSDMVEQKIRAIHSDHLTTLIPWMAASVASTPTSAASAHALAPASSSTNKAPAPSPTPLQTPSIFTNKQWVVPPRPKPGRKPAADTPPTKRKAQNRAAQRAFRERRAARVGELEEQMQEVEEENEKERESLQSQIQHLNTEIDRYSRLVVSLSTKCQGLEDELFNERRLRREAEDRMNLENGSKLRDNDVVASGPRSSRLRLASGINTPQASIETVAPQQQDAPLGCGNCSIDTRCECIEQAFEFNDIAQEAPNPTCKRPHSPAPLDESRRNRKLSTRDSKPEEEDTEIDFTEQFSTKRLSILKSATSAPDPCGFCEDGTACICAELAAEEKRSKSRATILSLQNRPKALEPSKNTCVNGPGSCQQCRSDANSTLFCKSLAASHNNIKSQPPPAQSSDAVALQAIATSQALDGQAITGVSLSCTDAYITLSRHPAYERATEDPGAWIPKLTTIPGGAERPAFEVEAASVMQTLRFFDRRFGRDA